MNNVSKLVTRENAKKIRQLLEQGKKKKEVAYMLGISLGTLYRIAHKYGFARDYRCQVQRRLDNNRDKIIALLNKGTPQVKIYSELGISFYAFWTWKKNNGLSR